MNNKANNHYEYLTGHNKTPLEHIGLGNLKNVMLFQAIQKRMERKRESKNGQFIQHKTA
jgi:hypothetical protein